jgi:hypothetical protein
MFTEIETSRFEARLENLRLSQLLRPMDSRSTIRWDCTRQVCGACLPGMAGYEILASSQQIRSTTYYDLAIHVTQRALSDSEWQRLQGLVNSWNNSGQSSWQDSGIFCRYELDTEAGVYVWDPKVSKIPSVVKNLVDALLSLCSPLEF